MSDGVRSFFDGLAARVGGRAAGLTASYVFDIRDAGAWTVSVEDGAVTVTEGTGRADATISASAETFEKLVARRQNPTTAYMTGKLKVSGDLGAAMKLQKLF